VQHRNRYDARKLRHTLFGSCPTTVEIFGNVKEWKRKWSGYVRCADLNFSFEKMVRAEGGDKVGLCCLDQVYYGEPGNEHSRLDYYSQLAIFCVKRLTKKSFELNCMLATITTCFMTVEWR
jgi:hypothetical protein